MSAPLQRCEGLKREIALLSEETRQDSDRFQQQRREFNARQARRRTVGIGLAQALDTLVNDPPLHGENLFVSVPDELILRILQFVDYIDIAVCARVCSQWRAVCTSQAASLGLGAEGKHRLQTMLRMCRQAGPATNMPHDIGIPAALCFFPIGPIVMVQDAAGVLSEAPRKSLVLSYTRSGVLSCFPETHGDTCVQPPQSWPARIGDHADFCAFGVIPATTRRAVLVQVFSGGWKADWISTRQSQMMDGDGYVHMPSLSYMEDIAFTEKVTACCIAGSDTFVGFQSGELHRVAVEIHAPCVGFDRYTYAHVASGAMQAVAVDSERQLCAAASSDALTLRWATPAEDSAETPVIWSRPNPLGWATCLEFIGKLIVAAGKHRDALIFNEGGQRIRSIATFPEGVKQICVNKNADLWLLSRTGALSVHFRADDPTRTKRVRLANPADHTRETFAVGPDNSIYAGNGALSSKAPTLSRWGKNFAA